MLFVQLIGILMLTVVVVAVAAWYISRKLQEFTEETIRINCKKDNIFKTSSSDIVPEKTKNHSRAKSRRAHKGSLPVVPEAGESV
mmetsp:Transcript_14702/g.23349  ORF Transcript_14702/g.23349 Transcript_14702/m.23349 type:complete len:85 (+) Transcript_14702:462-716(+)